MSDQMEFAADRAARRRAQGLYKRLFIFCDGTGQQTDAPMADPQEKSYFQRAKDAIGLKTTLTDDQEREKWNTAHSDWVPSSNVTRLSRLIKDVDVVDGKEIQQLCFYQNGVATGALTALGEAYSGAFGVGLNTNICEAYVHLCLNWIEGDEIFIFGFSRGAFTARALSGLIQHIGIMRREDLGGFQFLYNLYERRTSSPEAKKAWENHQQTSQEDLPGRRGGDVKIKIVGVWDTVKSLGLPENDKVRIMTHAFGWDRKFAFHDAFISSGVENAFHALALDEKRAAFSPTLWYLPAVPTVDTAKTRLEQCWFPGAHSDVGGSYFDAMGYDSADLSLLWMIRQCEGLFAFNGDLLNSKMNWDYQGQWWGAQPLHNSFTPTFWLNGTEIRKPGQYFTMENVAEKPKNVGPTHETIHPSVRLRLLKAKKTGVRQSKTTKWSVASVTSGPVVIHEEDGKTPKMEVIHDYHCLAMEGYVCHRVDPNDASKGWKWVNKLAKDKDGKTRVVELFEDVLGEREKMYLVPEIKELLFDPDMSEGLAFPTGSSKEEKE